MFNADMIAAPGDDLAELETDADLARVSISRLVEIAEAPELWLCRECNSLNFILSPCQCGAKADRTLIEQGFDDMQFGLPNVSALDETSFDKTLRFRVCPICRGTGEDSRGPCRGRCRRLSVVPVAPSSIDSELARIRAMITSNRSMVAEVRELIEACNDESVLAAVKEIMTAQ